MIARVKRTAGITSDVFIYTTDKSNNVWTLPNICGQIAHSSGRLGSYDASGAFSDTPATIGLEASDAGTYGYDRVITFNAASSNSTYHDDKLQPSSLQTLACIRA